MYKLSFKNNVYFKKEEMSISLVFITIHFNFGMQLLNENKNIR